jgi:hypothetical protein
MFMRTPSAEPIKLELRKTNASSASIGEVSPATTEKSVTGSDLKIIGQSAGVYCRLTERSRETCKARR